MELNLKPQDLQRIREGLRYMAREVIQEHYGKLRYSHQRGATCTCGAQVARYYADNDLNAGLPLNAAAIAQIVAAMRPEIRTLIMEMVPATPPPQQPNAVEGFGSQLPPEEAHAAYALKVLNAEGVDKAVPLADTFPEIPWDVAEKYSKQAVKIVSEKREAGDKNVTYENEHSRLCYQHMAGDRSSEFQRVKYAAEADVASRQHAALTASLESRVKHLEATGPSGDRRKKLADEAAEKVYYARRRGESANYSDVLQRLHREAGLRT